MRFAQFRAADPNERLFGLSSPDRNSELKEGLIEVLGKESQRRVDLHMFRYSTATFLAGKGHAGALSANFRGGFAETNTGKGSKQGFGNMAKYYTHASDELDVKSARCMSGFTLSAAICKGPLDYPLLPEEIGKISAATASIYPMGSRISHQVELLASSNLACLERRYRAECAGE